MYRKVSISLAPNLTSLRFQLERFPTRGRFLRSLDLSSIDDVALPLPLSHHHHHTTEEEEAGGLASDLEACIDRTPLLQHLLISPKISNLLPTRLFEKLFTALTYLKTLSLENCITPNLTSALTHLLEDQTETETETPSSNKKIIPSITLLNLSHCTTLPSSIFELLTPHLSDLQVLNVEETQMSCAALKKIPRCARVTHLNLNRCAGLEEEEDELFKVLRTHPAFTHTLSSLELAHHLSPSTTTSSSSSSSHLTPLLSTLTLSPLRILDLSGHNMETSHLSQIKKLADQELQIVRLGRGLSMDDIEGLFWDAKDLEGVDKLPVSSDYFSPSGSGGAGEGEGEGGKQEENPTLKTLRNAILSCKLKRRIRSLSPPPSPVIKGIKILDLTSLEVAEQVRIQGSVILGRGSLKMVVLGGDVYDRLDDMGGKRVFGEVGWDLKWDGKRCWIVRRV